MKRKAILFWGLFFVFLFLPKISLASVTDLVISEIMYDAVGADSAQEWVEIYNSGLEPVEVLLGSGSNTWRFFDGSNHLLNLASGTSTIASGEFFIIASNAEQFLVDHPDFSQSVFDTVMSLPNSSSSLALSFDGGQSQGVSANYDANWGANGDGRTLEKTNLTQDSTQSNWHVSSVMGGTPGQTNGQAVENPPDNPPADDDQSDDQPPPAADNSDQSGGASSANSAWQQIIISEFLPNPTGSDVAEWIELYNQGASGVDLNGFKLQDNSARVFAVDENSNINLYLNANSYLLLYKSVTGISLNNTGGDSVRLYDPTNNLLESISYSDTALENKSYARQNSSFVWTATPTPGAANQIVANLPPQAKITLNSTELKAKQKIILTAADSSDPEEGALEYFWDFGDDFTGDEKTENHVYDAAGSYLVKLKVVDSGGLFSETSRLLEVSGEESDIKLLDIQPINFSLSDLIISEFLVDPVGSDDNEWIELYNAGQQTINLAAWQLDDAAGGSRPYIFNASSTLEAGQFLLIDKKTSRLSLNNQNDEVRLLTPLAEPWQTVAYTKVPAGQSQAWDSENQEWFFSSLPTPGSFNLANNENEVMIKTLSDIKDKQLIEFTGIALADIASSSPSLLTASFLNGELNFTELVEIYFASKDWPLIKKGDVVVARGQFSKTAGLPKVKIKQKIDLEIIKRESEWPTLIPKESEDVSDDDLYKYIKIHGVMIKKNGANIYIGSNVDEESNLRLALQFDYKDLVLQKGTEIIAQGVLSKVNDKYKLLVLDKLDLALSQEVLGEKIVPTALSTKTESINDVAIRKILVKKNLIYLLLVLGSAAGLFYWYQFKHK